MKKALYALLLAGPTSLLAQVPATETPLTPEAATSIVAFYNHSETIRLNGDSRVAAGSELGGNVALLEGTLELAGRVRGNLVVINGDVVIESGARVDGTLTVVGGGFRGSENLTAAEVVWHRERLKHELRDGELVLMHEVRSDELSVGREFGFGRTDLIISVRGGYNRSEGLPVNIGARVRLGHRNPTLLDARFIYRSAVGLDFDEDDFGYALTAEQFVGGRRAARIGVRISSEVLPVEAWGLSDRENSLAAFVLHRDYRDHFVRDGWTAFVAVGRTGMPLDWRIEYGNYEFRSTVLRDPFSILHNDDEWRAEVLVAPVRLHTLHPQVQYDTRNDDHDPSSGWLVRGNGELGLSLRSGTAADFSRHYRYGLIDARRYARLSPSARLSLRAVAAGSIDGDALPVYRQQSLGGEGSLPGYELHDFDCGGHNSTVNGSGYVPYYGCDRLLLFQMEYQSDFRWLSRIGRNVGSDFGLLGNIKWVLFFDAGRTWNEREARGDRGLGADDFVADAGLGLRFGTLGAYWAVPLSANRGGMNFFVRLGPRI
jgi:hypothetical protein